jgi:hypothetical protein
MNTTKMRGDDAPLLDHPGEERYDRALEIILAHTRRYIVLLMKFLYSTTNEIRKNFISSTI